MSSFLYSYLDYLQQNITNPGLYTISKNDLNISFNNFKNLLSFFALFIYPENHKNIYYNIFKSSEDEIEKWLKIYREEELSRNTINNLYSYIFNIDKSFINNKSVLDNDYQLQIFRYSNIYIQQILKIDIIINCFKMDFNPSKIIVYTGSLSSLLNTLVNISFEYINFIP